MRFSTAFLFAIPLVAPADLQAQSVQLPSYHYFASESSVLVPDQGRAALGGVGSGSSGQNQFGGVPGSRSRGAANQAGGATISAFVHDFAAWDEKVLAEAAARRHSHETASSLAASAAKRTGEAAATGAAAPDSVSEVRARRLASQAEPQREAEDYFDRAQAAQAQGKPGLARVYYQMAARRAGGELRSQALAEIAALGDVGLRHSAAAAIGRTAPR